MKAKDLMIGDWVKVHFGEPNETIGNDMYGPVSELYDDGRIEVAFNDEPSVLWNIEKERGDEILPIPLTPEILEKNGFIVGYKQVDYEQGISTYYYHIGWDFYLDLYGGEILLKIRQDCDFTFLGIISCKYVHELQHALKLCGIGKEIEL